MHPFKYIRPTTLPEAVTLYDQLVLDTVDAKLLAGGQTLLASLKLRLANPEVLLDLNAIADLRQISGTETTVTVGAMCTHSMVAASEFVATHIPALSALAGGIGDRMVRNRGTLGGSIANNDPAACYPAALLALDAVVITNERRIDAQEFFRSMFETALHPSELITAVEFRRPLKSAYVKFKHPASRFAIVGVFVAQADAGARVAVTGAAAVAFRLKSFEAVLDQEFSATALSGETVSADGLNADMHASGDYRANLIGVVAQQAVAMCVGPDM